MNTELVKIVEENQLEQTQGKMLIDHFTNFFEEARGWEEKARGLVVTDVSQVEEMQQAREARLALKNIRVNAENTRKQLKEKALREGRAIDGIANVIKALIVPIEEYLEKQEKFAENLEKERMQKVIADREEELRKYVPDISLYNYRDMSDEAFDNLVRMVKTAWETEQAAVKKAKEDRLEAQRLEREEQERIWLENERLKKEAEERALELTLERIEQERKLEEERLRAQNEAQARQKAEAELYAKKEEEARLKRESEAKELADRQARLEAEKKAQMAPDRDKLLAYARALEMVDVPKLETEEGKLSLSKALGFLGKALTQLKNQV